MFLNGTLVRLLSTCRAMRKICYNHDTLIPICSFQNQISLKPHMAVWSKLYWNLFEDRLKSRINV